MSGREVSGTLTEDLADNIIARVPFPYIFKARLLSNSWLARFEAISSQDDEDEKKKTRLVTTFQKQVTDQSNLWGTFCPIRTTQDKLMAFDQASQEWRNLPSLSFLSKNVSPPGSNLRTVHLAGSTLQIRGALFYGRKSCSMKEHYVGNILTRRLKQLPSLPNAAKTFVVCAKFVCDDTTSNTYKVILVSMGDRHDFRHDSRHFATHVYDSKSETWSTKKVLFSRNFDLVPVTCAHLHGVLYMMSHRLRYLRGFNLEEGTWKELTLSFHDNRAIHALESAIETMELAVCNDNLVIIVRECRSQVRNVRVLQIDVDLLSGWEVARCPPITASSLDLIAALVSDVDCIFFQTGQCDNTIVAYDQKTDEWSFLSFDEENCQWSACSFQPGLNPFARV